MTVNTSDSVNNTTRFEICQLPLYPEALESVQLFISFHWLPHLPLIKKCVFTQKLCRVEKVILCFFINYIVLKALNNINTL